MGAAVGEERLIDHAANGVAAMVAGVGAARAIPEPSGHRFTAADQQRLSEHIAAVVRISRVGGRHGRTAGGMSLAGVGHKVLLRG